MWLNARLAAHLTVKYDIFHAATRDRWISKSCISSVAFKSIIAFFDALSGLSTTKKEVLCLYSNRNASWPIADEVYNIQSLKEGVSKLYGAGLARWAYSIFLNVDSSSGGGVRSGSQQGRG